jgi:hypothetical protein
MQSATESVSRDVLCVFDASGLKCIRCGYVSSVPNVIRNCVLLNDPPATPANGPGTELKKLLARVGITATPDCSCNARAAEMDRQGVEWCEANLDTIVGWLREQAEARGLPFLDIAGRLLVRRAIQNARKAAPPSP